MSNFLGSHQIFNTPKVIFVTFGVLSRLTFRFTFFLFTMCELPIVIL